MKIVSDSFIFRSGRYVNKTYEYVTRVNPTYIDWILINRPEMLTERSNIKTDGLTPREKFTLLMEPNNNFDNE